MSVSFTTTSDATLVPPVTFTTTSDATLVPPVRKTLASDAYLVPPGGFLVTSDAMLVHALTVTSDATLVPPVSLTTTSDALIAAPASMTGQVNMTSNALLVYNNPGPPLPPPDESATVPGTNVSVILGRFPCAEHIDCPGTDLPVQNYSTEAPDPVQFIGNDFGPQVPPPLGSTFTATGCISTCSSPVSQQAADLCAALQSFECVASQWNPPTAPTVRLFFNEDAFCDAVCPDGSPFQYFVPRGTFAALSQQEADAQAASYACRQAKMVKVCMGAISQDEFCAGTFQSATVQAIGADGAPVNLWQVIGGQVPPGMVFSSGLLGPIATLSGTPTAGGSFTFDVRVQTPDGNFMQKQFTVCVLTLTPSPAGTSDGILPDAAVGQPYSENFNIDSCAEPDVTWSIVDGALPDGLDIDFDTGEISGTPTTGGTYTFTIQAQTGQG